MGASIPAADSPQADARSISRLRWRCRRGLLENDLLIERFFDQHIDALTTQQVEAMERLMALSDNDLLSVLLGRMGLPAPLNADTQVLALVGLLRPPSAAIAST